MPARTQTSPCKPPAKAGTSASLPSPPRESQRTRSAVGPKTSPPLPSPRVGRGPGGEDDVDVIGLRGPPLGIEGDDAQDVQARDVACVHLEDGADRLTLRHQVYIPRARCLDEGPVEAHDHRARAPGARAQDQDTGDDRVQVLAGLDLGRHRDAHFVRARGQPEGQAQEQARASHRGRGSFAPRRWRRYPRRGGQERHARTLRRARASAHPGPGARTRTPAWLTRDPSAALEPRRTPYDVTRAIPFDELGSLWSQPTVALREKLFWRMHYATAARASEV